MNKKAIFILSILTSIMLAFISCSAEKELPETVEAEKQEEPVIDTAVTPPSGDEAMAVFITGEVNVTVEGSSGWRELEIGDVLTSGMNLEVATGGYCELEFPDKAIIRIQEDTELSLSSILNASGDTGISMSLNKGSVLCRVNKLVSGESFQIKTESSVAGVRGTEFMVNVDEQMNSVLAVREGAVQFFPVSLHPELWKTEDVVLAEILADLDKTLPLVEAGSQMIITLEESKKFAEETEKWEQSLQSGNDGAAESAKAMKAFLQDELEGKETPISDENREALDKMENLHTAGISEGEEPVLIPLTIRTSPSEAEIFLDENSSGFSEISMMMSEGQTVKAEARLIGYHPASGELSVEREGENLTTLSLAKIPPQSVKIQVTPSSAQISEEGKSPVTGEKVLNVEYTESHALTLAAPSYNRQKLFLEGEESLESVYQVQLEPEIHRNYRPSTTGVVGVAASDDLIISADSDGTLTAMREDKKVWSVTTINTDNQNSVPVTLASENRVAFSGQNEFIMVDAASGEQLVTQSLDQPDKHIFGRRAVEAGEYIVFPGNESLKLYRKDSGELIRDISIPEESRMYPLFDGKRLYLVNLKGEILAIGLDGEIQERLSTDASQMIGVSMVRAGKYAFFGDKKGKVFGIRLNPLKLMWSRDASADRKVVFSDSLSTSVGGVYAYYRGRLYGFDTASGRPLFTPVSGLTTPPLSLKGYLYAGNGDELKVIDPVDGMTVKTIALEEHNISSRPVEVNGRVAVPCEDGWVYEVNPLLRY